MTESDIDRLTAHAEFYYCLSRAFLTPQNEAAYTGMREALADDLDELGRTLGYGIADTLADYRTAIAAIPGSLELLQLYSALFLAPPRTVQINTGSYLDGSLNGGSVVAMEHDYLRHGVEREENFHDLSDHVAIQLEFIAYLFMKQLDISGADTMTAGADENASRAAVEISAESTAGPAAAAAAVIANAGIDAEEDARNFLHTYVRRWLPPFIRDLEQEAARLELVANPYLHLARILQVAALADARAPEISAAEQRAQRAITKARHERAQRGVTAEDMQIIARKLREKGLSTDHLTIAPEQRDEARGHSKKTPPSPRRGSRLG